MDLSEEIGIIPEPETTANPEPKTEPGKDSPGNSIVSSFIWFGLTCGLIIFAVILSNRSRRDILFEKIKNFRLRKKPNLDYKEF
jgi:hypothetical protein